MKKIVEDHKKIGDINVLIVCEYLSDESTVYSLKINGKGYEISIEVVNYMAAYNLFKQITSTDVVDIIYESF